MEHLSEIIENIVPFLFAGTVVFIVFYFRHARRREAEQTIRMAIEKGQLLDAAVIEKLLEPPRRNGPGRLRIGGIIVTSVGLGLASMYFILGKNIQDDGNGLLGAGALVGIIGLGLFVASLAKPEQLTLPPRRPKGAGSVRVPDSRTSFASFTESAVVILAMAGNDAAFGEVVARRQSWVRNLLRRLSGNAAMADDLAQLAFVQAWKSIKTLRNPEAFGGWLRQIAVNWWLAEARKAKATTVPLEEAQHLPAPGVASEGARIDLDRALASLKENERMCIVLSYNEGLSHGEIAETTGLPLGTVKSHVARGADRMRELLAAYGGVR